MPVVPLPLFIRLGLVLVSVLATHGYVVIDNSRNEIPENMLQTAADEDKKRKAALIHELSGNYWLEKEYGYDQSADVDIISKKMYDDLKATAKSYVETKNKKDYQRLCTLLRFIKVIPEELEFIGSQSLTGPETIPADIFKEFLMSTTDEKCRFMKVTKKREERILELIALRARNFETMHHEAEHVNRYGQILMKEEDAESEVAQQMKMQIEQTNDYINKVLSKQMFKEVLDRFPVLSKLYHIDLTSEQEFSLVKDKINDARLYVADSHDENILTFIGFKFRHLINLTTLYKAN
jgi:hypothetical protein